MVDQRPAIAHEPRSSAAPACTTAAPVSRAASPQRRGWRLSRDRAPRASALPRLPPGRALRHERPRPLRVILALLDHLEVAGRDLLGLRDGEPEALEDAHLRAPHREGRV